ncbi:MAG: hypothetical protein HOL22_06275 [Euryarchaeota archaeon]|nr:hypothetical protein [Euryarchaeota archaeon]
MNLIVGSIGETVKTRKITTTIVALTLIFMATSTLFNETNELQPDGIIEFSHEGVANGTAILGGVLTWQDDMWDASWNCSGGLALVAPLDWDDFVASGEYDPHNYTSWGIGITGADSYYTENAPEGEWVVTAGLDCIDDMGDARSAGGQYGDVHENPPTVNLTNGTTTGDVSFTLIEYGEYTFVCGDGDEIPFSYVNDGDEDCDDGSDEQQYDADGNEINWFDCHDGTMIWVHQVNDGNDDCPDGEDELGDEMSLEDIMEMIDADGDGYLSLDEIIDFINEMENDESGENISQEEEDMISDAFTESDSDGDGLLDIDELETFSNLMDDMDDGNDGPTFVCGDGEEIPFNWVNDGYEDCDDGSDEQQYDADGNEINWFDCYDGTMIIWVHQVNDGNEDCSDGEDEGGNGGEYPICESLMNINFNQMGDHTAELSFSSTCVFDSDDSANMSSYWDTDGDGNLSSEELTSAQDQMNEEEVCYAENGTEVPCADDDGDDGLFSFDGTVMTTQPEMGDDSMSILSVDAGIVTISSTTQVITLYSNDTLFSHTFGYDAGADWDGGNDECMGGLMITATSPWSVSNVSFLPATDWIAAMYADGSGWIVENFDADDDGHCNSQPSEVVIVFTTPEPVDVEGCMNSTATNYNADATVDDDTCEYPEPVVDTAPTCEIYYNIGGVALTADSTWSVEIQSAVSVEMPADGEFSLALPVGEYSVIMVCNDAEGDAIVVSGTNGDETWNGTAQNGVIYSEGVFEITDADVNESVDVTLTWSSTTFSGTFNTHFTAVESLTDAIEETDVGALPGFTSMISITAMLGAALILARRKD